MSLDDVGVIIPAAGKGTRMGALLNKQYLSLRGRPLLAYTLEVFLKLDPGQIVLVVGKDEENICQKSVLEPLKAAAKVNLAPGGRERQDSVAGGLKKLQSHIQYVCIHDGARPLIDPWLVLEVIDACRALGCGAAAAVPLKDTLKAVDAEGFSLGTLVRDKHLAVQTPQVFPREMICTAYEKAFIEGFSATDDTAIAERYGGKVKLVPGSYRNVKITTPEDLDYARAIMAQGGEK